MQIILKEPVGSHQPSAIPPAARAPCPKLLWPHLLKHCPPPAPVQWTVIDDTPHLLEACTEGEQTPDPDPRSAPPAGFPPAAFWEPLKLRPQACPRLAKPEPGRSGLESVVQKAFQ